MSRAIVVRAPGGPDVLRLGEIPDPEPGPEEVVVEVAAAGVNFIDLYQRSGTYPVAMPFVPGIEGAGTVVALGGHVRGVAVGDQVAWANRPGGYATHVALPASATVPLLPGISADAAAAALLQGMTAHYLTHDTHPVRPGETVLVHAAAGGTGRMIVQMARWRGARVIATVSTAAKEQVAREAGADEVIRYDSADSAAMVARVHASTAGTGVDAVYDGVGGPTFDASLTVLRPRGTLVLYGQSGGAVAPFDPQRLNTAGSIMLARPNLNHHIADRAELLARAGAVFERIVSADLDVLIGRAYPLAEAAVAHADLGGRRTTGKLLLHPDR